MASGEIMSISQMLLVDREIEVLRLSSSPSFLSFRSSRRLLPPFPRGERLLGSSQAVRMNAPHVDGSFAVWGGLFSAFDGTTVYARQKEDPWNSIIAGAATGGFLQMRQGLGPASRSAVFGGVLLALIEGAGIMLNKVLSAPQNFPPMEEPVPSMAGVVPGLSMMGSMPGPNVSQVPDVSKEASSSSLPSRGLEASLVVRRSKRQRQVATHPNRG